MSSHIQPPTELANSALPTFYAEKHLTPN